MAARTARERRPCGLRFEQAISSLCTTRRRDIASYDTLAIRFTYTQYANAAAERAGRDALIKQAIEAATKAIGGMEYTFALRGDGQTPATIVAPAEQREALRRLIAAVQPKELAVSERIVKMIQLERARCNETMP